MCSAVLYMSPQISLVASSAPSTSSFTSLMVPGPNAFFVHVSHVCTDSHGRTPMSGSIRIESSIKTSDLKPTESFHSPSWGA